MHQTAGTSFCLAVSDVSPAQPCASGMPQEETGVARFLELPSGSLFLLRPSSGHGRAAVMPEELILRAGTQQFMLKHMMPLFSPKEPLQGRGGELRPRVRRASACTGLSSCPYILNNMAQGTRVAESAYAGLTMDWDSWEVVSPRSWLGIHPRTEASLTTSIPRWFHTSKGSP